MLGFLSEENVNAHKEYHRSLRLKYSILEKSIIGIKNKTPREIIRQKLKSDDKREVLGLLSEIILHDVFFSSFGYGEDFSLQTLNETFGSRAAFLFKLLSDGMKLKYGFVCAYSDKEKIWVDSSSDMKNLTVGFIPAVAIDVCEHAYFSDYGFDKERYLRAAISRLDLSRLAKK